MPRSPLTLGTESGALELDVLDGPRDLTVEHAARYAVSLTPDAPAELEAAGFEPRRLAFTLRFTAGAALNLRAGTDRSTPAERYGAVVRALETREVVDAFLGAEYLGRFVLERVRAKRGDAAGLRIDADVELLGLPDPDAPYSAAAATARGGYDDVDPRGAVFVDRPLPPAA
jgi:hypothetical protein